MRRGRKCLVQCVVAVGLAVGAVGCSGSDAGTGETNAAPGEVGAGDAETRAAADLLVDRWGDEGAFVVVVRAFDLGYRAEQIVDASDTFEADGTSTAAAPEAAPFGMLTELPTGQSFASIAGSGAVPDSTPATSDESPADAYIGAVDQTLAEVFAAGKEAVARSQARDDADALLELGVALAVLKLGMQGYSGQQIVEAIILGDLESAAGAGNCSIAVRSNGGWLEPALLPARELACDPIWSRAPDSGDGDDSGGSTVDTIDTAVTADIREADEPAEVTSGGYRLTIVLDASDETGVLRYQWDGTFRLDDAAAITGTGTVEGSTAATCSTPGAEGTVESSYAYAVTGEFDITGRASGDQLELAVSGPTSAYTSQEGDRNELCVDIAADLALELSRLPLGAPELGLGLMVVPATGGSTIVDSGEGLAFAVEVSPV